MYYIYHIFDKKKIGLFKSEQQVIHYIYKHRKDYIHWNTNFKIYLVSTNWKDVDMTDWAYRDYREKYLE